MNIKLSRFLAIFTARNTEFWRDRSALGWSISFPVLVVLGFAFAFNDDKLDLYKVGIVEAAQQQAALNFRATEYIKFVPVTELNTAITRVSMKA